MEKSELFWALYKNLEDETLNVFDYIYCSDCHLNVYSMHIADLVVRCAIEIESLSKEIYRNIRENHNEMIPENYVFKEEDDKNFLMFDTDCLSLLNRMWGMDKRCVIIASVRCFFEKDGNKCFRPLKNSGKRGNNGAYWNRAYQALKHDRLKNIEKGNIKALLHAIGALYLLNIYYMNEVINLGDSKTSFDASMGSRLFSLIYNDVRNIGISGDKITLPDKKNKINNKDATYILKVDDNDLPKYINSFHQDIAEGNRRIHESHVLKEFLKTHPESLNKNIFEQIKDAGLSINQFMNMRKFMATLQRLKYVAILNKNQQIYPTELIES